MRNNDTQLLCTFSTPATYPKDVIDLGEAYEISGNRIYVLIGEDDPTKIFLTYNVPINVPVHFQRTILIHRKRDYNILYSINALNELIQREYGGDINSTRLIVDWSLYRSSLILMSDGNAIVTRTRLKEILYIKK